MYVRILSIIILVVGVFSNPLPDDHNAEKAFENVIRFLQKQSQGRPNPVVGQLVDSWRPGINRNPEELGNYTQGDILMPPISMSRNGLINVSYRWPKGVVYYRITGTFTDAQRNMINLAINEYHKSTCIKFLPYTGTQTDYISIESSATGCWANLGRIGGMQKVNLQTPGCLYYVGTVIHELMHAIGFYHEQSRTDRDNHVTIQWQNVQPGKEHNFDKYESTAFGVSYDYGSVLHYSKAAFSSNGLDTIVPKVSFTALGQRKGFSQLDIDKIRAMYKCSGTESLL